MDVGTPHRAVKTSAPERHDAAPVRFRVGDLVLDLHARSVCRGSVELKLPPLSFDLLAVLVRRAPKAVSTRELLDEVWPGLVVGTETVTQRIKLLRSVLGDDANQPRYVAGMRGKGYRVIAAVERLGVGDNPAVVAKTAHEAAVKEPPLSRRQGRWGRAAALLLAVALAAAVWIKAREQSPGVSPEAAAAPPIRIAVSVIENAGAEPFDALFAAGLHDDLIAALARRPGIDVIFRPTMVAIAQRKDAPSPRLIARETGATHVVLGSLEREKQQARLSVRLLDARTAAPLLEQTFEAVSWDIARLPAEVASGIAAAILDASDRPAPPVAPLTSSQEAFDLYLRALHARAGAIMTFSTEEAIRAVEEPLARAVQLDARFSAAQAELAMVRLGLHVLNLEPGEAQIGQARQALELAYRGSPREPKVLAAKAAFSQWIVLVLHALRMSQLGAPADAIAALDIANHGLSGLPALQVLREQIHFSHTGDMAPLLGQVSRWGYGAGFSQDAGVDPAEAMRREADLLRLQGKFRELQDLLQRSPASVIRSRQVGAGHEPLARLRGWADLLAGDHGSAVAQGRQILDFLGETTETRWNRWNRALLLAEAHLFTGNRGLALATLHTLDGGSGTCIGACAIDMRMTRAAVLAWSDARDEAVRELESLANGHPSPGPALMAREPLFTIPLRDHTGFQQLLDRLERQMSEVAERLVVQPQAPRSQ